MDKSNSDNNMARLDIVDLTPVHTPSPAGRENL